jgi:hypothetical protein
MARNSAPVEINKFSGGLFTDSNPLTSPDGYSLDEVNMVLNIDGSRNRRLGMDFEEDYSEITTTIAGDAADIEFATFKWENAGGDPEKSLEVVQVGNEIKVFDLDITPLSDGLIHTHAFSTADVSTTYSFAVVDGILIATTGEKNPTYFEYTAPSTITSSTFTLRVRDFFGVEDIVDDKNLFAASDVQERPSTQTDAHVYNLRNQSFGIPRINGDSTVNLADPIVAFRGASSNLFPSNSDDVTQALYANPENTGNRTIDRFYPEDLFKNPLGTAKAASGYFIIDALERGTSRLANEAANRARYPTLSISVNTLPVDRTPGGPTVVAEFAGRVWYAGFSGEVVDGDERSPRMSSYLLFSKIVDNISDVGACFQEGDPTSREGPEIVDTDGGYVRINGAFGIKKLVNLSDSLMIIAQNGVWRIVGGTEKGFTATSYIVEKITERGCSNAGSVAVVDNSVMFWGDDAIYHVKTDQFGSWVAENVTFGRIQRLFDDISIESKRFVKGNYDNFERKVRWLYNTELDSTRAVRELILDTTLKAYYVNEIQLMEGESIRPVSPYVGEPYQLIISTDDVFVGGDPVVVVDDEVVVDIEGRIGDSRKEIGYVVVTSTATVVKYTFASYRDTTWYDWVSHDDVGVDAAAYVVTGYVPGPEEDKQRDKQVPYLTVYMKKTETGFLDTDDGDYDVLGSSSVKIQVMWDWTNSGNSGKWGRVFQAYRHRRLYFPSDDTDTFEDGNSVVVTRNKIRGNGRVLSIKFSTEPGKDFHLYGWSMIVSVAGHV